MVVYGPVKFPSEKRRNIAIFDTYKLVQDHKSCRNLEGNYSWTAICNTTEGQHLRWRKRCCSTKLIVAAALFKWWRRNWWTGDRVIRWALFRWDAIIEFAILFRRTVDIERWIVLDEDLCVLICLERIGGEIMICFTGRSDGYFYYFVCSSWKLFAGDFVVFLFVCICCDLRCNCGGLI